MTAFSNSEEKNVGKESEVPFLLEDKLKELGAKYEKVIRPSEQTWTARKSISLHACAHHLAGMHLAAFHLLKSRRQ